MSESTATPVDTTGQSGPWRIVTPESFHGIVMVLFGVGQFLFALSLLPVRLGAAFVVVASSSLLMSVGTNLLLGNEPFETERTVSSARGWIYVVVQAAVALAVLATAAMLYFGS